MEEGLEAEMSIWGPLVQSDIHALFFLPNFDSQNFLLTARILHNRIPTAHDSTIALYGKT